MRFKNFDLVGVTLVIIVNLAWIQVPQRPWFIGIVLAVPLTFMLPGYAITQAIFPKKPSTQANTLILKPQLNLGQPIGPVDYFTLGLGLSMAIDVLVGFILNVFPIGLQAQSWTISLGSITFIFVLIAFYQRRKDKVKSIEISKLPIAGYQYLLFGLAILLVIFAVGIALVRPPATQNYFTQFWMLSSSHTTASCAVDVGVQNFEAGTKTYKVIVTVNNTPLQVWNAVNLAPKEKWERIVSIQTVSNNAYVEAKLYNLDRPEVVYREVHMTLNNSQGSNNATSQC